MVADLKFLGLLFVLQQAMKHAILTKEWVVIVCPSSEVASECSHYIASLLPPEASFSGRTVLFPNEGHLSVLAVQEDIFLSDDQEFTTAFVGWSAQDRGDGMLKWQDRASKTFKFSTC